MLVCLDCWEVFDYSLVKDQMLEFDGGYTYCQCPKRSCKQGVVDIDECLIPAIRLLNEKGYHTVSCCSGHYWDNHGSGYTNSYIMFESTVRAEHFKKMPIGFNLESENSSGLVLRLSLHHRDFVTLHIEVLKAAVRLTKWAKQLPILDEPFEMVDSSIHTV